MRNNKPKEKIHIHKVVQMQNCTYERARQKYEGCFDEKGMIETRLLGKTN